MAASTPPIPSRPTTPIPSLPTNPTILANPPCLNASISPASPASTPSPESPSRAGEPEIRDRMLELMAAHYDGWVSEKIPALGGVTPLEAVGDRVEVIPNHICPCVNLMTMAWLRNESGKLEPIPIDARASRLAQARDEQIVLASDGAIRWLGEVVGRLTAGDSFQSERPRPFASGRSIFASSEVDALRALGWVVARDRLFQLELQARAGGGRLTAMVGGLALDIDRVMASLISKVRMRN